jgi:hypothetical protein
VSVWQQVQAERQARWWTLRLASAARATGDVIAADEPYLDSLGLTIGGEPGSGSSAATSMRRPLSSMSDRRVRVSFNRRNAPAVQGGRSPVRVSEQPLVCRCA